MAKKLVELLHDAFRRCWQTPCSKCDHFGTPEEKHCQLNLFADHLVANGVTMQKHGRWLYSSIKNPMFRVCDQCANAVVKLENQDEYKYCPNCGAKMEDDDG